MNLSDKINSLTRRDFLGVLGVAGASLYARNTPLFSLAYAEMITNNDTALSKEYSYRSSLETILGFNIVNCEVVLGIKINDGNYSLYLKIFEDNLLSKKMFHQVSEGVVDNGILIPLKVEIDRDYAFLKIFKKRHDKTTLCFIYENVSKDSVKIRREYQDEITGSSESKDKVYSQLGRYQDQLTAAAQTWLNLRKGMESEEVTFIDSYNDKYTVKYKLIAADLLEVDLSGCNFPFKNIRMPLNNEFEPISFSSEKRWFGVLYGQRVR